MKKVKVLLPLCMAATVFFALAFANNVVAIFNWWSSFIAAGGDSSAFAAKASGFIPWLDWAVVDYSAVTTFIPLLGFLCMTLSLSRMLACRRARAGDFPFFRGSDQLNVALGLLGTLWGIIVIGYFKLDTVTMADLMQCLHTALFSTLAAVVWVFLIDRPLVRPYFTRLLEETGLAETDDGDLAAAVDRLVVRLGAASDAFEKRQQEFEAEFRKRACRDGRRRSRGSGGPTGCAPWRGVRRVREAPAGVRGAFREAAFRLRTVFRNAPEGIRRVLQARTRSA